MVVLLQGKNQELCREEVLKETEEEIEAILAAKVLILEWVCIHHVETHLRFKTKVQRTFQVKPQWGKMQQNGPEVERHEWSSAAEISSRLDTILTSHVNVRSVFYISG